MAGSPVRTQPGKRLLQSQEFIAVFFQELAPAFEGETAIALGQQGKEKHRDRSRRLFNAPESEADSM